ncbi:hypothetical protein COW36_20620 [bacterium (Candidatus Blackallbacteria) CG17_big_fil_post_rev_8_21_14_2_50_48_46]|uniref:Phosphoenolpyruvate synthase n=1 Tax=bacterium (Candidatus Blackallbacteria) CG17_big_fil_post_rev_8_21_14_2_50_48_46 TaxID=2014261 RepID=A0A2M7FZ69_9BACT|nr:MAG: hypothetical protein COW64_16320 [bacterium (Candidatus Blackallbacteria) CG18_big_fil_WC_8_21_14_2_50_49_26]PIW14676.1 MAG: hypothetical protein COW36_20620 [bacterium (Candidatus Blackallbacteria) CG17_big_fil_post_rev_8_21_14_2_50_48_46]PIW49582.1 MAG: hypothetical protein COW20_05360 [bacterium (Candidatus Blackallbacteria) CG13_big_fil_rev_8_21_14_2_50_49_14]
MADSLIYTAQSPETCWPELGGKAQNLWHLSRQGLPVPDWWVLSTRALELACEPMQEEIQRLLSRLNTQSRLSLEQTSFQLQQLILELEIPAALREELRTALPEEGIFAVRSSALGEDSPLHSFAGQLDTWLCVPRFQLEDKLRQCWAGLFNERLLVYLHERGLDPTRLRLAVVIQRMVESRASGVIFTANPLGDLNELVISAGYGLGEGVVSDQVETDTYRYQRGTQEWEVQLSDKLKQVLPAPGGGTQEAEVPEAQRSKPVLDSAQRITLLALALKAESRYQHCQDLEWAQDAQGNFWLLQARPITTIPRGQRTVFDNSNVVESYPGITTPLTFSYIRGAYEILFRNSVIRMGVPHALVFSKQTVFRNLIGHLQGRVYYNLSHWYAMFRLLPGTEPYIRVWEEMMGIRRREEQTGQPRLEWKEHWREWLGIARKLGKIHRNLDAEMLAFREKFQRVSQAFQAHDLQAMDSHALLETYTNLCSDLLYGWEITVLNDGFAFIFSGLSRKLLEKAGFADSREIFNHLLCGVAGMESVEPVRSVIALAEQVRAEADLHDFLERHGEDPEILTRLRYSRFSEFYTAVETHLAAYGDRSLAELKLESPSLREAPQQLMRWILGYVPGSLTVAELAAREAEIRTQAESRLQRESRLNPLMDMLFRYCLKQARRSINYRESSRLDRARSFGLVRQIFNVLGQKLAEAGALEQPRDIFLLSIEELMAFVYGHGWVPSLKLRVAERRIESVQWYAQQPRERLLTQGPVGLNLIPQRPPEPLEQGSALQGTGCAPGLVTGEALIVTDPAAVTGDLKGKILVAEMTDPGWVFLMISAAGLVVEKGSLLSHTAIIGRELGIPTIVGVSGATRRIQNGQRLSLNGQTGQIQILENGASLPETASV